ncbi:SMP-30/gluconolactonase/LRE family protein [Litoribacillus peritrichatus]|uniref:SMP-30/gluconolactonase/LRE family protein n=1 Tax=Litoribacillus peritrichatus TaxID=718191 RepID=A0ABP7M9M4_9GAMM
MFNQKFRKTHAMLLATGMIFGSSYVAANNNAIPQEINFSSEGLYPEGIDYSSKEKAFYLSSVSKGQITKVTADGTQSTVVLDDALISSIGLKIDTARNRLIVCNSDPGVSSKSLQTTKGQLANIAIYDIDSGKKLQSIDLTSSLSESSKSKSGHLANDVTLDSEGNLYITDSFAPVIYKVTPDGQSSVFIEDERLATAPGTFGLNGIEFHPDGYLITAIYDSGRLFKIPLNQPTALKEITFEVPKAIKIDGLLLTKSNQLALVTNSLAGPSFPSAVYQLTTTDQWNSARLTAQFDTGTTFPTTLTEVNDELFVVYSHLHQLFSGTKTPVKDFKIQKVEFSAL